MPYPLRATVRLGFKPLGVIYWVLTLERSVIAIKLCHPCYGRKLTTINFSDTKIRVSFLHWSDTTVSSRTKPPPPPQPVNIPSHRWRWYHEWNVFLDWFCSWSGVQRMKMRQNGFHCVHCREAVRHLKNDSQTIGNDLMENEHLNCTVRGILDSCLGNSKGRLLLTKIKTVLHLESWVEAVVRRFASN